MFCYSFSDCVRKGAPFEISESGMIYIKPYQSHEIVITQEITYIDIYCESVQNDGLAGVYCFDGDMRGHIETVLNTMYREYVNAPILYEDVLKEYYAIVSNLISRQNQLMKISVEDTENSSQQIKLAQKLQEIASYVRSNPQKALSLQELAEKYHYSASYLSRSFTALFGVSYTSYVYRQRFQRVCYLIKENDTSVDGLLEEYKISDISRFYKDFKTEYLMTPQQYRLHLGMKNSKM